MDGENGGMGYWGQTEEEEEEESDRLRVEGEEERKRGRAGGDECAAISSWLSAAEWGLWLWVGDDEAWPRGLSDHMDPGEENIN